MRAKKFACCLMVMSLLAGISFISCGNSSRAKVESEAAETDSVEVKSVLAYDITLYDAQGNVLNDSWSTNGYVHVSFSGSVIEEKSKEAEIVTIQYTRVKFPLKTPVTLLADDGETEKTFPFTKEKWPLLDSETLKEERITQEEGGIYVSKFTLNEPAHKVFEAGYEESEIDLRVEFELLPDGKWYVVDCYTGWYGYDLPIAELKQTIQHVQEENAAFKELHP